jgi:hypothetical protein
MDRGIMLYPPTGRVLGRIHNDISVDSGVYSPMERVLVAGTLLHELQSTKSISLGHRNESCYKWTQRGLRTTSKLTSLVDPHRRI